VSSTRISRRVNVPRAIVYRALLDARAVATWMVQTGMTSQEHAFDAPTGAGKTTAHTDTCHGRFVKLVANEEVVEVIELETTNPISISIADANGGTHGLALHDGLPRGLSTADNEVGWRESLAKLAALVEAG
jgi:uncharacterized protein YndB with AHSA1/START domain